MLLASSLCLLSLGQSGQWLALGLPFSSTNSLGPQAQDQFLATPQFNLLSLDNPKLSLPLYSLPW